MTDAARRVAGLFLDPPPDAQWRPVLRWWLGSPSQRSPPRCARAINSRTGGGAAIRRATFAAMRACRPMLPPRFRSSLPTSHGDGEVGSRTDDLVRFRRSRIRP